MKKFFFLVALAIVSCAAVIAQSDPYVIELEDAVWNFDDYENSKAVLTGQDNFVCPVSWFVGNAGSSKASAAYTPFIYPSKLDKDNSYGYDGRLCMRIYGIASTARVPVYIILPVIKDKENENLVLNFFGKGETPVSSSRVYYANLRIGYLADIADTAYLKSSFTEKVVHFKDTAFSQAQYDKYEISLAGIPSGAHVVLYDDDATKINSCLFDNISFTEIKSGPETSIGVSTEKGSKAVKVLRDGKVYIERDGRLFDVLGKEVR